MFRHINHLDDRQNFVGGSFQEGTRIQHNYDAVWEAWSNVEGKKTQEDVKWQEGPTGRDWRDVEC